VPNRNSFSRSFVPTSSGEAKAWTEQRRHARRWKHRRLVVLADDQHHNCRGRAWHRSDAGKADSYAVSQGWLIVQGGTLTLTTAGLAAA
jgi:hypothetical protein